MSLLLKIVYTAVLFGFVGIAVNELRNIWFDTQVYIGRFEVVSQTGKDAAASESFSQRVVAAQAIMAQQLQDYQGRPGAEGTFAVPSVLESLRVPQQALEGIDITIQTVNLRQVLTALRRGFLTPNELTGSVIQSKDSVQATFEWPEAPRAAGKTGTNLTKFTTPNRESIEEVATYIACAIAWARATSAVEDTFWEWLRDSAIAPARATSAPSPPSKPASPPSKSPSPSSKAASPPSKTPSPLSKTPLPQFCDFVAGLQFLYSLEGAARKAGLNESQAKAVLRQAATLRAHYAAAYVYPEIYRLRADLLDLLPEGPEKLGNLVDAQGDRLRYAMLNPALQDLPAASRALAAIALARPALPFDNGKLGHEGSNWSGLLGRQGDSIANVASATGVLLDSEGRAGGTGVIVAENLVLTTAEVLRAVGYEYSVQDKKLTRGSPARFCLAEDANTCTGKDFPLLEVLYDGNVDKSPLALVKLERLDPSPLPQATIADIPAAKEIVGRYAYVIGYTYGVRDDSPREFLERLLGEKQGLKRLMPGRILAFGTTGLPVPWDSSREVFTTNMSTTQGTAGGPLVDLQTGRVLGINLAGKWYDERGKFAWAATLPTEALKIVQSPVRREGTRDSPPPAQTAPVIGSWQMDLALYWRWRTLDHLSPIEAWTKLGMSRNNAAAAIDPKPTEERGLIPPDLFGRVLARSRATVINPADIVEVIIDSDPTAPIGFTQPNRYRPRPDYGRMLDRWAQFPR